MDPTAFRSDLERIPATLVDLAGRLERDELGLGPLVADILTPPSGRSTRRIRLIGMGSSYSAAGVIAARLRAAGHDAVAELASAVAEGQGWPPDAETIVIGISATGGSIETLDALDRLTGEVGPGGNDREKVGRGQAEPAHVVALTNSPGSAITERATHTIEMHAGTEEGGVACRTYRHTLAVLMALVERLSDGVATNRRTVMALRRAAAATDYLLHRSDAWLPEVLDALASPDGTWVLAPSARLASAHQGALMIREGPRRRADACETGDWSHIDVYLTKTLDYRALVHAGSRYDAAAAEWLTQRRSTVVAVGGTFPDARFEVRYPGDDDTDVALLTEVLVAELVAATWWSAQTG